MALVARLTDTSDHGGVIITACSKTFAYGKLIARKGDLHSCPISGHGITPLVSNTSPDTYVEGKQMAKTGTVAGCGAVIVTGSPVTHVN